MEEDFYRVEILHLLNPHMIWVEVKNQNKPNEFVFEQIGIFGVLPSSNVLSLEQTLQSQKCRHWKPAAANLLKEKIAAAEEVWFAPTHIDRRSSIFDNNIHKFGELIVVKGNSKKKVASYILKAGFARNCPLEFYKELSGGRLHTRLDYENTEKVINILSKSCKSKTVAQDVWSKAIQRQTQVVKTAHNLESAMALTSEDLKNRSSLNDITPEAVEMVLQRKLKDLQLCKDDSEESVGRASSSMKAEAKNPQTNLKRRLDLLKSGQKKHEIPHRNQDPSLILESTKKFLEDNATLQDKSDDEKLKANNDVSLDESITLTCHADDKKKAGDPEWDDDFELEPQRLKSTKKIKKIWRLTKPEFQAAVKSETVAFGPPGMNPQKLAKIYTVGVQVQRMKEDAAKTPTTSEESCHKTDLNNYINNLTIKTVTEDNKVKLAKYTTDGPNLKFKVITVNHVYKVNSSMLQKRLRLYEQKESKSNNSLNSGSDTTAKDSSSSVEEISEENKKICDFESEEEIRRIINKLNVNNTEMKPLAGTTLAFGSGSGTNEIVSHANPFLNIETYISVFVNNLISPTIMAHSKVKKPIQPSPCLSDINFNKHIHTTLKNMGIERPMTLQYISWQSILRGYSFFIVSPIHSGKTLGYLPSVCRTVTDSFISEDQVGTGPTCIIVCATSKAVSEVARMAKMFLGLKEKVLSLYAGIDDLTITTGILNGCDLLVCTAPLLSRIIQSTVFSLDLNKLATFVLDDYERLDRLYSKEVRHLRNSLNTVQKTRFNNKLKIQYVVASRVWCESLRTMIDKVPNPVVCIGAFQECVLYAKAHTTVSIVKKENKLNTVLDFLKTIDADKKTVIVCQTSEEVDLLEQVLKASSFVVAACNTSMTVEDLYNFRRSWFEYTGPVSGVVLVCCDDNLSHLNITNAHYLIHYSLPRLYSMFCRRFSVLIDFLPSIFKETNENVHIKVMLEESNSEQLPRIINFVRRCTENVPNELDEICKKILFDKDARKAKQFVPLCDNLLTLGKCVDFWNCQERHSVIKRNDTPKDWMPTEGVITFRILVYHSAVLYSARLLTNIVNGTTKRYPQSFSALSLKLGLYYSNESNRKLHGVPKVGDLCAVAIKSNFYVRCQVLRVMGKTKKGNEVLINLIDVEKIEKSRDIHLYYLPEELKKINTHVAQVRLGNVFPRDKDLTFSELALNHLKKITDGCEDLYLRGTVGVTVGNCIFVNSLEACQDLKSLNEVVVKHNFFNELLETHGVLNEKHIPGIKDLCNNAGLKKKSSSTVNVSKVVRDKLPEGRWAHLENGDFSMVFFASAVNPSLFFIRLAKFEDCMELLMKDINKFVEKGDIKKVTEVKTGDIVLAKFPDDATYERARVEAIVDEAKVKCFFVDQGDWREVLKTDLAKITPNFVTQIPFQAIECRLIGVKPVGDNWTEFGTNWLADNCYELNGKPKLIHVKYFTKEAAKFTTGHKYGVVLVDTNEKRDVVVNQSMIDFNLAQVDEADIHYLNDLGFKRKVLDLSDDEDDKDWEKPKDLVPFTKSNPENDADSNSPLAKLLFTQPIRSVPLIGSDDDASDCSDKWNVNMGEEFMSMFKPILAQSNKISTPAGCQSVETSIVPTATAESSIVETKTQNQAAETSTLQTSRDETVIAVTPANETVVTENPAYETSTGETLDDIDDNSEDELTITANDESSDSDSIFPSISSEFEVVDFPKDKDLDSDDLSSPDDTEASKTEPTAELAVDQTRKPKIIWRQNKSTVTLKIQLIGVEDYKLEILERELKFSAVTNDTEYSFILELYGVIDDKNSTHSNKGQYILVKLSKTLNKKWLSLTRGEGVKKWVVYDVDSIDASSDEEAPVDSTFTEIVKKMHYVESESEDDDFFDDINPACVRNDN